MIDLHCHLDLYPNPRETADACKLKQIFVLSMTTTPSAWEGTSALAAGAARIRTALGIHPQIAHQRIKELDLFERFLPVTRYVGEVGLDGSPELRVHWDSQVTVFRRVLDLCRKIGGRVLSIHSRRAASAVLDSLESSPHGGTSILHWFSGTKRELDRAIALGCWFSVGPAMLAGEKGRALVSTMPRDRVLTETDGPFAQVGGRAANPWDVVIAENELAKLWSVPRHEVETALDENFRRLLGAGEDPMF
ncbi:MAG: TatD family hydrolase [Planctomycetes bacterium]|nr:TatD family hydrolase [Planctomycetota bacterium]